MSLTNCTPNSNIPPIFIYDEEIRQKYPLAAGLDEAGRGPLAGPVVAAAVILPAGLVIEGLRDSKIIPEKNRIKIFWQVVLNALHVGVGIVDAETIDRINILQATKRAMKIAVKSFPVNPDILLIDAVRLPDVDVKQNSMIKGESVSASIAAASIVAKVVRDDIMQDYHEQYPVYNFKRHKGYSTKEHMELIRRYGPCLIHRKTFRKVADVPFPFDTQGFPGNDKS